MGKWGSDGISGDCPGPTWGQAQMLTVTELQSCTIYVTTENSMHETNLLWCSIRANSEKSQRCINYYPFRDVFDHWCPVVVMLELSQSTFLPLMCTIYVVCLLKGLPMLIGCEQHQTSHGVSRRAASVIQFVTWNNSLSLDTAQNTAVGCHIRAI